MVDTKFTGDVDTLKRIISKIPSTIGNIQVTLIDPYMARVITDPIVLHKLFIEYTKDHLTSLTSSATNLLQLTNNSINGDTISKESVVQGYLHLLNIRNNFVNKGDVIPNYLPMEKLLSKWKKILFDASLDTSPFTLNDISSVFRTNLSPAPKNDPRYNYIRGGSYAPSLSLNSRYSYPFHQSGHIPGRLYNPQLIQPVPMKIGTGKTIKELQNLLGDNLKQKKVGFLDKNQSYKQGRIVEFKGTVVSVLFEDGKYTKISTNKEVQLLD